MKQNGKIVNKEDKKEVSQNISGAQRLLGWADFNFGKANDEATFTLLEKAQAEITSALKILERHGAKSNVTT